MSLDGIKAEYAEEIKALNSYPYGVPAAAALVKALLAYIENPWVSVDEALPGPEQMLRLGIADEQGDLYTSDGWLDGDVWQMERPWGYEAVPSGDRVVCWMIEPEMPEGE